MYTLSEYLMGRIKEEDLDEEMKLDALHLLSRVSELMERFYKETGAKHRAITSGYRTAAINAAVGGAKKSNHMLCRAVDIADADGSLDAWVTDEILKDFDLYREAPSATKTWTHFQIVAPRSGNRTFLP